MGIKSLLCSYMFICILNIQILFAYVSKLIVLDIRIKFQFNLCCLQLKQVIFLLRNITDQ